MSNILDEDGEYEFWEYDYNVLDSKDYEELIRFRESYLEKHPNDEDAKWRLGEAYILNEEYERALKYLTLMYNDNYENINVVYSILDVLFALEKNENDFNWIEKPMVIRINEAAEMCNEQLKRKRKPVCVSDLYCDLLIKGYLQFEEPELYNKFISDERFDISEGGSPYTTIVKRVKVKKR